MIKKIHYIWFGGKPLPASVRSCIHSWQKYLPDWEIIQWNESNFPINQYRWVREAIQAKRYAFASDFVRLEILEKLGGGYLDTDVQLLKPIGALISADFISGFQNHHYPANIQNIVTEDGRFLDNGNICSWFTLQCGFIYSEPGHPFLRHCKKVLYEDGQRPFIMDCGTDCGFVIDLAMMRQLVSWGVKYRDSSQYLKDNMLIYDSTVFATRRTRNKGSYMVHWFDQSWKKGNFKQNIKRFIKTRLFWLYRMQ